VYLPVIAQLRCPVCQERLTAAPSGLRCPAGHSFDRARQGYVDLTAGHVTHAGDSADMVAAREALLTAGHFTAIATAVVDTTAALLRQYQMGSLIVEVGAGTGHYLGKVLDIRPDLAGLAVDVSKAALRRAARAHPRMAAVRADVWRRLPLADGSASVVLDLFAPRSGAEFARVLAEDGALVVVTAEPGHLGELVTALGLLAVDPDKRERLAAGLDPWFAPVSDRLVEAPLRLNRADAAALVGMGPSARHIEPAAIAAGLAGLTEPITASLSVRLSVWQPR
jgi:23S rRNA (guanine745-N1)-methyltransferase